MELKCSKCKKKLPLDCFYNNKFNVKRHCKQSECKKCNDKHRYETCTSFFNTLLQSCRSTAKNRASKGRTEAGICTVTKQDMIELYELQEGKCALSGKVMDHIANSPHKMSIDRIDNNLGYIRSNLRIVTWQVNQAINDMSEEDFFEMCSRVAKVNPREIVDEEPVNVKEKLKGYHAQQCRRWTEEDEEILKAIKNLDKETKKKLALQLNRTEDAIKQRWNLLH